MEGLLFPHAHPHRRRQFFVWLAVGAAGIVALAEAGLPAAAILAAASLLPAVLWAFFYDCGIYRSRPLPVLALTLGGGAGLGVGVTLASQLVLPALPVLEGHPGLGYFLGWTVALPLVQEAVKPLPVLILRNSGSFPASADGMVFGLAAGAAFAGSETVVRYLPVIKGAAVSDWPLSVAGLAVVTPLVQAACTATISLALWKPDRLSKTRFGAALPVAMAAHVLFAAGTTLLREGPVGGLYVLAFQAVIVALVLCYLSGMLGEAVQEERREGRNSA